MLQEAKDLQQNAVAELVKQIETKDEITFRAPTGSGKTRMMADFMNRILAKQSDVIFLVSSLSKGDLAEQNFNEFKKCVDTNTFQSIKPYLISSEADNEERLFIPDGYNIYVLARDLYAKGSKLKEGGVLLDFLQQTTHNLFGNGQNKKIWLIKDECHQATNNLDELRKEFFDKVINFSATPFLKGKKRGQKPDVEITDIDAENAKLIKRKQIDSEEDLDFSERGKHPETAIKKLEEIRERYIDLLKVHPCLIIQISNKDKADEEWKIIKRILDEHQQLKWMLIVNTKDKCRTNDTSGKLKDTSRWKEYAKERLSTIDVIIFKMVISEGWDIPRACMLYQMRDTTSEQLDEQVMGRVRRNPRLVDFETLPPEAQKLAMTAWIWGVEKDEGPKIRQVKLYGNETDIPNAIQIKTTRLKKISERKNFDISTFIEDKSKNDVTHKSIFELYAKLNRSKNDMLDCCYEYATTPQKWWKFCEHLDIVQKEFDNFSYNYAESMEVNEKEVSFPITSVFIDNGNYDYIGDWVWKHKEDKFAFDSESEQEWAAILKRIAEKHVSLQETGTKNPKAGQMRIDNTEEPERLTSESKKLWGKNFITNSDIKYEYYLYGIHSSYPDFVMKDDKGRVHLFEVKSVNASNKSKMNDFEYKQKIQSLKECYQYCSEKTGHIFYLPIKDGEDWQIFRYEAGKTDTLNKDGFIKSFEN